MEFIVTPETIEEMAKSLTDICETFVKENPDFYYEVVEDMSNWTVKVTLERKYADPENN